MKKKKTIENERAEKSERMQNAQVGQLNVASVHTGPISVDCNMWIYITCSSAGCHRIGTLVLLLRYEYTPNHTFGPRVPTAMYSCIKLNLSFMRNTLSCKFKYEFMHIAFANTFNIHIQYSYMQAYCSAYAVWRSMDFVIGRQDDMRRCSLQIFINYRMAANSWCSLSLSTNIPTYLRLFGPSARHWRPHCNFSIASNVVSVFFSILSVAFGIYNYRSNSSKWRHQMNIIRLNLMYALKIQFRAPATQKIHLFQINK